MFDYNINNWRSEANLIIRFRFMPGRDLSERSRTERSSEGPGLALLLYKLLLQGKLYFAGEGESGNVTVAVFWEDFSQGH